MRQITVERFAQLLATHPSPCISLYQPTHRRHPDNTQDTIRFRNLLGQLESSLAQQYDADQVRETLKPFEQLSRNHNFWNHRTDGLAIFCSPGIFEIVELQRPVQELLVVADSFHTKPLVRILQSADRYQVLCLSRHEAKLYEGNRDALAEVELMDVPTSISDVLADERSPVTQTVGSYGKRSGEGGIAVHHGHGPRTDAKDADVLKFFRAVDQGILKHHSRTTALPLMLVALAETQAEFRRISDNPFLLAGGIKVDPESLDANELRERAWKAVEPTYLERLASMTEKFGAARSRDAGSGDLSDVARAAVADKVATLMLEADRVIPGVLDRTTGAINSPDATTPHVDDMLDDLAELVLSKGGEVIIVPKDRMPTESGLAAIYRF
ncbi:hypothetical protein Mal15_18730 [Stieleria maiorica]|uniref:Uncharacterized protein n=1 Tax=Stieleria maiorica TaxID=2795974 RepID=A0A5B9M9P4_9BACT|nr:hypothetical protein [Stieleria maiorica]QEF97828.1 hypothetical protein Mal15_18730 [Stieleria maiorica]